ncbi:hypothetical protein [Bacillus thuringiensis]|nr:hypothetical protein [Bacillus thuringiensis]
MIKSITIIVGAAVIGLVSYLLLRRKTIEKEIESLNPPDWMSEWLRKDKG